MSRRRNKRYNNYNSQSAFLGQPYLEEEQTDTGWLQSWAIGAVLTGAALIFFNLIKLPSPLDVILPWLVCLLGVFIVLSWLWQWNADRAFARRTSLPVAGKGADLSKTPERLNEDYFASPITPAELEGSTIRVNHNGKPIESVAPFTPLNMRGYIIQRTPEMDDLSTWDLLTQPDFAWSTKYIGTIGEGGRNA